MHWFLFLIFLSHLEIIFKPYHHISYSIIVKAKTTGKIEPWAMYSIHKLTPKEIEDEKILKTIFSQKQSCEKTLRCGEILNLLPSQYRNISPPEKEIILIFGNFNKYVVEKKITKIIKITESNKEKKTKFKIKRIKLKNPIYKIVRKNKIDNKIEILIPLEQQFENFVYYEIIAKLLEKLMKEEIKSDLIFTNLYVFLKITIKGKKIKEKFENLLKTMKKIKKGDIKEETLKNAIEKAEFEKETKFETFEDWAVHLAVKKLYEYPYKEPSFQEIKIKDVKKKIKKISKRFFKHNNLILYAILKNEERFFINSDFLKEYLK